MSLTEIKLIVAALLLLGSASAGAWGMHHWDMADYRALELKIAEARDQAKQLTIERQDAFNKLADKQGELEAADQRRIDAETQTSKAEVVRYVTATKLCVPRSFMRLLDATAIGPSADRLPDAGSQSDGACADLGAVGRLIDNIGRFNRNRAQLDALAASVRELHQASEKLQPKGRR